MENSKGHVTFYLGEADDDVFIEVGIPDDQPHEEIKLKMLQLLYGINSGMFLEDCATSLIEHGEATGKNQLCSEIVEEWRDLILEYIKSTTDEPDRKSSVPCVRPTEVFRSRILS